jgi:hypothetical protein
MEVKVNTAKLAGRRHLHFDSIDELLAEIDRVEVSEKDGTLETLGNWSAGQILGHLASWIEYGYQGYPMKAPPLVIRLILKWMLKRSLRKGMPAGMKIPGVKEGTYGTEQQSVAAGAKRLREALSRLKSGERCSYESPSFGPMSHEDRIALNLRHAELHLGFIRY